MKTITPFTPNTLICIAMFILPVFITQGQTDSLKGFNNEELSQRLTLIKNPPEKEKFISKVKREYINRAFNIRRTIDIDNTPAKSISDCSNIDFENNTLDGWIVNGDAQIMSGGTDSFGGFPRVYPGSGKYSLRLNDNNISSKQNFNASASRYVSVGQDNPILNLHFAMVLLDFPHDPASAARFMLTFITLRTNLSLVQTLNAITRPRAAPLELIIF